MYWVTVVLISIVGTCVTDDLTDVSVVPLAVSTTVFGRRAPGVFRDWYRVEGTLSIHGIDTVRREAFYWLAILFTFALGTQPVTHRRADRARVFPSLLLFAGAIALTAAVWFIGRRGAVLCFWDRVRPLPHPRRVHGDLLSASPQDGGLGIGTITTCIVFFVVIAVIISVLVIRIRRDDTSSAAASLSDPIRRCRRPFG